MAVTVANNSAKSVAVEVPPSATSLKWDTLKDKEILQVVSSTSYLREGELKVGVNEYVDLEYVYWIRWYCRLKFGTFQI